MRKKIELKRLDGKVIFSYECEDNSVVKTIDALRTSGADLRYANLGYADFRNANLRYADLRNVNFGNADFLNADLWYANLENANLRYANLMDSNLGNANLENANFRYADLRNADLRYADLRNADLRNANLGNADLRYSDLRNVDLRDSNLGNANLWNANLSNIDVCENTAFILSQCPSEGSFVAWKKAGGKIIKLLVAEDAKRSSATTLKCRCSKAKVLAIEEIDGSESELKEVASSYNSKFLYRVGKTVEVADFDNDRWNECSTGIHFFIAREMAVKY